MGVTQPSSSECESSEARRSLQELTKVNGRAQVRDVTALPIAGALAFAGMARPSTASTSTSEDESSAIFPLRSAEDDRSSCAASKPEREFGAGRRGQERLAAHVVRTLNINAVDRGDDVA